MLKNLHVCFSKYTQIEIVFFITYFYVFRILTDLEYNFWEEQHIFLSSANIESALAFGTSSLLAFFLFYKGLHYCIRKKSIWIFLSLLILFLIGFSIYQKTVYFLYAHVDFFSEKFRTNVLRYYQSKSLGYSFVYMFRELLVFSALAYFIHYLKQSEKLKILKEQQLTTELNNLKAQLQPHFFFNTLNNIYGLALDRSPDTAPVVSKLAEMMRYILYHANQQCVPLQKEVSFLKSYVDIERIRHRRHVTIDMDVQGNYDDVLIVPLILLPFVENAFKHGINKVVDHAFVEIVLVINHEELHFQVSNSKALETTVKENEGGIGLSNVKKRLALLYPNQHKLDITEEKNLFRVNLTVLWKV